MDDVVRKYLKWRIDELSPEQVRRVIRYVAGLLAAEKEINNAPAPTTARGATNNHLQDTTEV